MDSKTTLRDIKRWTKKIRVDRGWNPDARGLAISIVLEAGELLEHFQWHESSVVEKDFKVDTEKRDELEKELGDVVNYICQFADRLDIDISHSLKKTLDKIEKKYPAGKTINGGEIFYKTQKKKYRKKKN